MSDTQQERPSSQCDQCGNIGGEDVDKMVAVPNEESPTGLTTLCKYCALKNYLDSDE